MNVKIHSALRKLIAQKPTSCERVRVVIRLTESVNEHCVSLQQIGFDFESSAGFTAIGTIPIDKIELFSQLFWTKHIEPVIEHRLA